MTFFKVPLISFFFLWLLLLLQPNYAQDFDFEIPEKEEAAILEFSGNLDAKWAILQTNERSPFYGLQFFGLDKPGNYLSQYRLDFYFNGDYRYKQVGFTMRSFTQYVKEQPLDLSFFELYGSLNMSPRLTFSVGKRRFNWGKGYAFNPVGYANAEKDPENPDLALAGKSSLFLKYNRSMSSGILQNLSLSAIVLPGEAQILERYSEFSSTSVAVKLYLLLQDIDLDFMLFAGQDRPLRFGFDFSTNLLENLEVHGELSYASDEPFSIIENNLLKSTELNGASYLLGTRYLNNLNMTFIAEYYHSNSGMSTSEYENYLAYIHNNVASDDPDKIAMTRSLINAIFRTKNLMQDYIYFKASLPEPFEWLYSSVSVFTIYNIHDGSYVLSPQIGYKPFTNSELLFWPSFFWGDDSSEYGSKQFQNKIEMWFRFYF